MKKFVNFSSVVAPLTITNIDTDMIIPKDFLKTLKRTGLGSKLFYEMRYDKNGLEIKDFVLNRPEYKSSKIILAGDNFGCGSSREHAPWALADFGISCIISTSFADIFYNNCFKNAILPAIISSDDFNKILQYITGLNKPINCFVDLNNESLSIDNMKIKFKIDTEKKTILLEGMDEISQTLKHIGSIEKYEENKLPKWLKN